MVMSMAAVHMVRVTVTMSVTMVYIWSCNNHGSSTSKATNCHWSYRWSRYWASIDVGGMCVGCTCVIDVGVCVCVAEICGDDTVG